MNQYRTHTCGQLRVENVNETVTIAGWIHRKRNLGSLCFIDLRDHYGITQCVLDSSSDLFDKIKDIIIENARAGRGYATVSSKYISKANKTNIINSLKSYGYGIKLIDAGLTLQICWED